MMKKYLLVTYRNYIVMKYTLINHVRILLNKYRPFCSQRCKLIDLGQWADESYRLPAEDDVPSGDTPPPQSH